MAISCVLSTILIALFIFLKMKKIFNLFFLTTIFSSVAVVVRADNSTCFMLDANGNPMNLGSLCQNSRPKAAYPYEGNPQTYQPNNYNYPVPQTYKEKGVHTIPIKSRRHGIPVIEVKFNNRHTFEMMLDTGASQIVITKEMAKILKVKHEGTVWVSTPSSNRVAMSAGYVRSVEVSPQVSTSNFVVITAPTMDMGLLGQSFFNRYDLTIKRDVVEFRER